MPHVVIVGARCAGATLGRLLAIKGFSVTLIDRSDLSNEPVSAHYIHRLGVMALEKWGLLDELVASGAPLITSYSVDALPAFEMSVRGGLFALKAEGVPTVELQGAEYKTLCPRRSLLDGVLARAAADAGARTLLGYSVRSLCCRDDTVVGVEGVSPSGAAFTLAADLVVGADGRHSRTARQMHARSYNETPPLSAAFHSYWTGLDPPGMQLFLRKHLAVLVVPTNGNRTLIGVSVPASDYARFKRDLPQNFLSAIREAAPTLYSKLCAGERVESYVGSSPQPGYVRCPWGNGWALVGDSGYCRDPITGRGISEAFLHAELLANAIDEGFRRDDLKVALKKYEEGRNSLIGDTFGATAELAELRAPSLDLFRLFAKLWAA